MYRTNSPHVRVEVDRARVMGEQVNMNREGLMSDLRPAPTAPRREQQRLPYRSMRRPDARPLPIEPLTAPRTPADREALRTPHQHRMPDGTIHVCYSHAQKPCNLWRSFKSAM